MTKWTDALKAYAAKNGGKYMVPKRGTKEYDEVKALMGASKGEAKAEEAKGESGLAAAHKAESKALEGVVKAHKKEGAVMTGKVRKPRAKKVAAPSESVPVVEAEKKVEKKPRKPRAKKAMTAHQMVSTKASNAIEAKPRRGRKAEAAGSVPAGVDLGGATARAIEKSKNPEAVLENATNAHLPVNPSNKVPKLRLPKGVAFDSDVKLTAGEMEMPALVEKGTVVNKAPFDFQALRRRLGA